MRRRHAGGQIGEERRQLGANFGIGVNLSYRVNVFRAALLHHMQPVFEIHAAGG